MMEETSFPENSTMRIPTLRELNEAELERLMPAIVYLLLLSVVGLIGNSLVCHVYRTKYRLSNCQCFILCLCGIDLFSCSVVIPFEVATITNQYTFEYLWLCKTSRFFNTLSTLSGSTLLVSIAVDRYRKVCQPFGWQISANVAKFLCVLSIFLGLLVAWPAIFIYGKKTFTIPEYNMTGTECSTDDAMADQVYPFINIVVFIIFFISGIGTVCVLYCFIGREVQKHIKKMRAYGNPHIAIPMLSSATDDKIIAQIDINVVKQLEHDNEKTKALVNEQKQKSDQNCKRDKPESDMSWSENQENTNAINACKEKHDTTNSEKDYNGAKSDSDDSGIKADVNTNAAIEHECAYDNIVVESVDDVTADTRRTSEISGSIKDTTLSLEMIPTSSVEHIYKQNSIGGNRLTTIKSRLTNVVNRIKSVNRASSETAANTKAKKKFLKQAQARKSAYLMFLITIAFVLSYLPHLLLMLIRQVDKDFVDALSDSGRAAYKFVLRSYFLNCAINPFIYYACDSRFRAGCKELFSKLRRKQ